MEKDNIKKYFERARIQQYKSDIGFRTLVESVDDNMYIIPRYQRKYRWKKAGSFIDRLASEGDADSAYIHLPK